MPSIEGPAVQSTAPHLEQALLMGRHLRQVPVSGGQPRLGRGTQVHCGELGRPLAVRGGAGAQAMLPERLPARQGQRWLCN
jgi:hypothetical protein